MPTSSNSLRVRFFASSLLNPRCASMPSMICLPMVIVGSSDVMGSWKTMAMWRPLNLYLISFCDSFVRSTVLTSPSSSVKVYSIEPLSIRPLEAMIPMMVLTVTDLPEPDSPTMAMVSPLNRSILTPLMALTVPVAVSNDMLRSRIDNTRSFFSFFSLMTTTYPFFWFGSKASLMPSASMLKLSISKARTMMELMIMCG